MENNEYSMIGNRLCLFWWNRVFCWRQDMIKIIDQLTEDWYTVINWNIMTPIVWLWFDFDCYIVLDTVEEIEIREAEKERRDNIRKAPIF